MNNDYGAEDKASILIVDDMPENLRLLSDMLSKYGYLVRPLRESTMAFSSVIHTLPDLILLDVMMPDMDGYKLCECLKADQRTRDIPVIFISALAEVDDKVKGFAVGGVDYITKPFQQGDVIMRIRTQIALRKAQQRLQEQNVQLHQEIFERRRAEEELRRRNRELTLLNQISQLFSSSLELDQVLLTALQEIQRLLNVVSTSIWLLIPETEELECRQIIGPGSESLLHACLPAGQGITGWVAQHGESVIVPDVQSDARHYKSANSASDDSVVRSMLSVPLKIKGNIIGVLNLIDPQVARFTQEDLRFIEPIAGAAAIAIENARLYTMAQQEITERKRAETALLAAHNEVKEKNAQLEALNASKDKFFSIISHDLRSPFNTLLGFAQLLLEQLDQYSKADILSHVEKLYHSAERLYALLENLLTWSRIQRGAMEFRPEHLNLHEITDYTLDLLAAKAEQKQITLTNTVSENISVWADEQMLTTIMRNLVSNAVKFTTEGGSVTISAHSRDDHELEVAVVDTGLGIPQEHLSKLFRIDTRYTNVGTAGESGTGLGLNLCKDLVEKHYGKIWVESEPGQGSVFRFTLPLTECVQAPIQD
ncbi:multi-sensor signal transduction histidine kinase [Candidatus Vecturithrix granuli]|uniref:histidine kinase n=1 Tax=Vecturithrix granuli TaxID=1499967 RepID=A0A081BVP4_VECG1|nr:multi-sensor signal transduction histidine kinase [Candidatus Vecturithrix granuli]